MGSLRVTALVTMLSLPALALAAPSADDSGGAKQQYNGQYSVDSSQDHDAETGAQWGLGESTSLNFSAEESTSSSSRADLVTHTYDFGLDQDLSDLTGFGLTYEWWGKKDAIEMKTWKGSFFLKNDTWKATLLPGQSSITVDTLKLKVNPTGIVHLDDHPLGLQLDYTGLEDWKFEAATTRHDYSHGLGFLGRVFKVKTKTGATIDISFLNASAFTLAHSFLSHESSARIERDFGLTSVAFDYELDRSGINGSYSYTPEIDFQTPVSDSCDIEITAGVTRTGGPSVKTLIPPPPVPTTRFITVNLIYYH